MGCAVVRTTQGRLLAIVTLGPGWFGTVGISRIRIRVCRDEMVDVCIPADLCVSLFSTDVAEQGKRIPHRVAQFSTAAVVVDYGCRGQLSRADICPYRFRIVDAPRPAHLLRELGRRSYAPGIHSGTRALFSSSRTGCFCLPLLNYHYWSDLVQAELVRLWHLPLLHVFFQYAPIFLSIWTTALLLRLVQAFGGKTKALLVTLFVFTFGGDAAYLITQVLHGSWGEGVSSLDSGVTFYFNIPQVYARFVFLGAIFALLEWWQKKNFRIGLVAMMLIASLLGFKVYYAMYAALGLISVEGVRVAVQLYTLLRKDRLSTAVSATLRSALPSFLLAAFFGILAVAVYLPVNKSAGGLTYSFFEWPHLLLSADNINYQDWFLRMQVYREAGNLRNIVVFNVYAVVLTFIAVYGTRLFGFLPFLWPPRTLNPSLRRSFLFFLPATVVFLVFGLFTLQTSGGLNIFNFLIVPILFFNIWLALSLDRLSWKVFVPVFLLFAVLTLPRSVLQLQGFFRAYQQHKSDLFLSSEELEAFRNVQRITSKDAIVQALPNDRNNELSAYVSFFGGRRSYVAGTQHLDSHNQPGTIRQEELEQALSLPSFADKKKALQHLGVEYLYIRSEDLSEFDEVQGKALFQNEVVTLLSVSDLAE